MTGNGAGTVMTTALDVGAAVEAVVKSVATAVVSTVLTSDDGAALGDSVAATGLLTSAPVVRFVSLQAEVEITTTATNTNEYFRTILGPSHADSVETSSDVTYDVGSAIVAIARQFSS